SARCSPRVSSRVPAAVLKLRKKMWLQRARVAKSVYAWALKAQGGRPPCRFESCPEHLLRPPPRHPLRRGTGGERRLRAPVRVHHVNLAVGVVPGRHENDLRPIPRPCRGVVVTRCERELLDGAAVGIHHEDVATDEPTAVLPHRCENDPSTVGRPCRR